MNGSEKVYTENGDKIDKNEIKNGQEKNEPNTDLLTSTIGEFGKWQTMLYVVMIVPTRIFSFWTKLLIVFLAPKTTFKCLYRSNATEILNSTCYSDCVKYEYYSEFDNTITSQWDLICDREWLANLTQTLVVFGVLMGSLPFGYLADRYGRRPTLLIACTLKLIISFIVPFAPSYWSFTILRFIEGLVTSGIMFVPHIIYLETTSPRKRELINSISVIPAPLSTILLSILAYLVRSWNMFLLGIGVFHLVFLTYYFLIPESPKWLISMGKLEEAKKVMTKAAICNRLPTDQIAQAIEEMSKTKSNTTNVKTTYLDLILKPSLRIKNMLSCIIWFMIGFSFYGSYQYVGQTSDNIFYTLALSGLLQCIGMLTNGFCSKRYGRHISQYIFLFICALCNFMLTAPDDWYYYKMIIGCIGVGAGSGAFGGVYMYTSELFPTVTRNMGLGASSSASRIGSMISPFVAGLGTTIHFLPPVFFGVAPLIAACACYFLPETKGIQLKDYIED